MKLEVSTRRLDLKHTWTTARGSADFKEYHFVALEHERIVGVGEAAHNVRYGEDFTGIGAFLEKAKSVLLNADPWHYHDLKEQIHSLDAGLNAAKAALDMALLDWVGKKLGVPLHRLWGLNKDRAPLTSYSIGIDHPEVMQQRILAAEGFPILKIKLGSDDEAIMNAVRAVTDRTIRVDANEGWKSRELALERILWLAEMGVEFVEQPLPAGRLEDIRWLRERSPLPLVADEDVKTASDIPALAQAYDGINIKIMKAGGLQEAMRMIQLARMLGMKIMLGCMIESSLGITAAAHLSPLVDWADLDGNLLINNDPYFGVQVMHGRLMLPEYPGIGAL